MNCEEFEVLGLDGEADEQSPDVLAHLNSCSHCAALRESWLAARLELQALRQATQDVETPARVEAHLLQAFRAQKHTSKSKQAALFGAWALAAAAVLLLTIFWHNWRLPSQQPAPSNPTLETSNATGNEGLNGTLTVTHGDSGEFTLLPGSMLQETDNAAIVRVRLQRGALGVLGLPVDEENAGEWIQVDLLVGDDGRPEAVRLPKAEGHL